MPSILLTNFYSPPLLSIIKNVVTDGFEIISLDNPSQENIIEKIPKAEYLLVGGRTKIDGSVFAAGSCLKMIQRTGVGLDSIDLETAKNRNIPVYINHGINSRSVAEHTIMLLLSVMRNLTVIDKKIKSGVWIKHEFGIKNNEIFGKTIGLIGLGNIGRHVVNMLQPFGVKLIYYKPTRLSEQEEKNINVSYTSLTELLATSDIISLHCPLSKETEKLIDWDMFSLIKKGSIIINTSRGKLINEDALIYHLRTGHIKAAGLDVYEQEPISSNSELLSLDNVILTPHISGITYESFESMMREAFNNIKLFDEGKLNLIEEKRLII